MLKLTSVGTRLLVSMGANIFRAALSFLTGVIIARSLNPSGYGDLMFLLGSFSAIRMLLDMGCSNAFYTFLSRSRRGRRFFIVYFVWLLLQFLTTILLVALLIPSDVFERVWLGHNREIVLLACVAAFLQQQVWQTVGQIGEAMRMTVKVQFLNLCVAITYLVAILLLSAYECISVERILGLLIGIYAIAALLSYKFLQNGQSRSLEDGASLRHIVREYWLYCKPMLALPLVGFLQDFADKWMLQRFGGAAEQGYFQVANQFSAVSLLATTSILSIFWKEVAEALGRNDQARVAMLYHKVSRGLVMVGAITTGLLLPWAEQIVGLVLGVAYASAWPVLAVMLLFPIHSSMGQIGGTMLLAGAQTKKAMTVSFYTMAFSIPMSYFMLAPVDGFLVPGLGMGAIGMASKMVLLNVVAVNAQALIIARYSGWKFDWLFQAVGIPLMVGLGYLTKMLVELQWNLAGIDKGGLIVPVGVASVVYVVFVLIAIWSLPWLVNMERADLKSLFASSR